MWSSKRTLPGRAKVCQARHRMIFMKRIIMFGGGSGSRDITMALCRAGDALTRVVPAWDSGGSSKALREALGILAMGDIRQALMTMAHGEGRVGSVVRFFNARMSDTASQPDLQAEFDFYLSGTHPLLGMMAPGIRDAVLNYLRVFRSKIGNDFNYRRGSIGNFVLTGAYFAHGRDINTAIGVFRKLCGINGHVWPATTDDRVELRADLRDGSQVRGQDSVTALPPAQARIGIQRVHLTQTNAAPGLHHCPMANPAVLEAIGTADAIVFGPGSFYTSTMAHLAVNGITQAISATAPHVPKILIGNILECPETTGRTLAELQQDFALCSGSNVLTHLIVNQGWVPFERVLKGFRYLPQGCIRSAPDVAPQIIADDFEDPWNRGKHDASKIATTLAAIVESTQRPPRPPKH